jgi:hypothetical protein
VNAFTFESILVLYHLVKNMQKRGMMSILLQPHILFIFSSMHPHALGLSTYVSTGRRVEELRTCIWFCECINDELDISHHE